MSVAWALNVWATNSWVGMNGGPPNAWRGASTPAVTPSGGFPSGTYVDRTGKLRHAWADLPFPPTREQVRKQRQDWGILPKAAEVIERVAERQAKELPGHRLDDGQRVDELIRELDAESVQWEGRYLDLLQAERERIITAEIAQLEAKAVAVAQAAQDDLEAALILMVLMA